MPPSARWALVLCLPIAAAGFALARGKKQEEAAAAPEPSSEVAAAPAAAPAPEPAAPPLFPAGLPVVVEATPSGVASLSAQSCNACHWAAHDGWSGSAHAHAWSDAGYQAALKSAGNSTACLGCHLPLAAQHDQLAAGYVDGDITRPRLQDNAAFDASLMSEGVTCAACHVRDGQILGTHSTANAPHAVVVSKELGTSEMCATCHQLTWPDADRPFYDTYGEWKASAYAAAGVGCPQCHMAPVAGVPQPGQGGVVAAHASPTTVQRALTTLVQLPHAYLTRGQAVDLRITLINSGAGHDVPTGNPFKSWTIEVAILDGAGRDLAPVQRTVLARTVEKAAPWRTTADDRLAAGAQKTWTAHFAPNAKGAPGAGAVIVRAVRGGQAVELRRIPVDVR
jgi:hypothetical protein